MKSELPWERLVDMEQEGLAEMNQEMSTRRGEMGLERPGGHHGRDWLRQDGRDWLSQNVRDWLSQNGSNWLGICI